MKVRVLAPPFLQSSGAPSLGAGTASAAGSSGSRPDHRLWACASTKETGLLPSATTGCFVTGTPKAAWSGATTEPRSLCLAPPLGARPLAALASFRPCGRSLAVLSPFSLARFQSVRLLSRSVIASSPTIAPTSAAACSRGAP